MANHQLNQRGEVSLSDKPYMGAYPHMRQQPEIRSEAECARRTEVVLKKICEQIDAASAPGAEGVQIGLGHLVLSSKSSASWQDLIESDQVTDDAGCEDEMITISFGDNITHKFPREQFPYNEFTKEDIKAKNGNDGSKYTLLMGQPSNYVMMAIQISDGY